MLLDKNVHEKGTNATSIMSIIQFNFFNTSILWDNRVFLTNVLQLIYRYIGILFILF